MVYGCSYIFLCDISLYKCNVYPYIWPDDSTLRLVYNCPKNYYLVSTLNLIDANLIALEMTRLIRKTADSFCTSCYQLQCYITDPDLLVDSSNITYVHEIRAQRRRQGGRSDKSLAWDNSLILLPPNLEKLRLIISACSRELPSKTNYFFCKLEKSVTV